jgi:hypothetical protein
LFDSGDEDWEVWAHGRWDGHFELAPPLRPEQEAHSVDLLVKGAQGPSVLYDDGPAPIESFQLDVQVAAYNARGDFQYLYRRR